MCRFAHQAQRCDPPDLLPRRTDQEQKRDGAGGRSCDGLRQFFAEKADEARRLELYRYSKEAKRTGELPREDTETLMQYLADGATRNELANIFGYKTPASVSAIINREWAAKTDMLLRAKARQSTEDPSLSRETNEEAGPQRSHKVTAPSTLFRFSVVFGAAHVRILAPCSLRRLTRVGARTGRAGIWF